MHCKDTLSLKKLMDTRKADADIAPYMNLGSRWNSCAQARRNVKAKSLSIAGTVMRASLCGPQPSHYSN